MVATAAKTWLRIQGRASRDQDDSPLEAFSASQACYSEAACAVKLECHAVVPLCICHLEQIDLRHRTGNVDQGIDSPKMI